MSDMNVQSAKRWMLIGYMGIIIGGIVFIVLMIASGQYVVGGAVGWGCGFGTTIYSAGKRAIASLEKQMASRDVTTQGTEA